MQKPILFTGAFCSNQEWIESILSVFPSVHYLPHFFSPNSDSTEIFSFQHQFPFISSQEDNSYKSLIEGFFEQKEEEPQNTKATFGTGFRQFYNRFVDKYQTNKETKKVIRPLIYDKHGIFLAEWLHKHYQADVIVLIQHPFSFVTNWIENKKNLDIDTLFSSKLTGYAPNAFERIREIKEFENLKEWQRAIKIWLVFAETILHYQLNYPDWLFFRYEDFREKPERTLTDICDMLDLGYTEEFLIKIKESKEIRNQGEQKTETDYIRALINETKEYLTHFHPQSTIGKRTFR